MMRLALKWCSQPAAVHFSLMQRFRPLALVLACYHLRRFVRI